MFKIFKSRQIHESLEKQKADITKLDPLISKEILNGLECDMLPNNSGSFGSINNPIPINGPIGEIKYLGKLRGKTGKSIFFHRTGSFSSAVCNNPVDCYEIVCLDGTQWNKLYFDMYHPRRSNIAPKGYTLMPFDKKLNFDIPMGFGVDEYILNFPFDLPEAILNLYGSEAFSKKAKKWLEQCEYIRPIDEILKNMLIFEKEELMNEKKQMNDFTCNEIFQNNHENKFLIERFIFLKVYLEVINYKKFDIETHNKIFLEKTCSTYNINREDANLYFEFRFDFYKTELEMYFKFKSPHPGKIIWCLYNPTIQNIAHDIKTCFESNFLAGMYLLNTIMNVIKVGIELKDEEEK